MVAAVQIPFEETLREFNEFGAPTQRLQTRIEREGVLHDVPTFVNEFWTSKQRDAHSLHEISYRACFKPQLPRFFIERLTLPGQTVYDPFMGRGTTLIEAALCGRIPVGCDANPLSAILVRPRIEPPELIEIRERLDRLDLSWDGEIPDDLLAFYHVETLREICALKQYLIRRDQSGELDRADAWIRMVAINRLTGHSPGFFSVYSMPPNQALSVQSQRKINEKRNQTPPARNVKAIILKKSKQLLDECDEITRKQMAVAASKLLMTTALADRTTEIPDQSVDLVVTSPPFLNVVNYALDNWLRCWFCDIEPESVKLTVPSGVKAWRDVMTNVFHELRRVVKPGGHIAFEVGEVKKGKIKLEEVALDCGLTAGFDPLLVMINAQKFTKTSNCWGVDNGAKGTNTNRIAVFRG